MTEEKISEKELDCAEKMVRIAHDLIESDVMLKKLEEMKDGEMRGELRKNPMDALKKEY